MGDVPVALPALTRAVKLQHKAAKVGFDWPSLSPVFDKLTTAGFISVDQTVRVETKAQRAARIQAPATPAQGPLPPPQRLNEHITMYNNDMVIFYWSQTSPQGTQNFTETWVKEGGQWKCAASHVSTAAP